MAKAIECLINLILLSLAVLTMGSCNRHGAVWDKLDAAEKLMDNKPDSALALLEDIPAESVKGKETAARYALLKSIALDKNYIDTTAFDVLQPAIDYYVKHGTPDEQLRTYYYQGRIYQNQGDDDSAMRSFMAARDLKNKVTDTLLLAHTLVAQGSLYIKQYKTKDFVQNNIEAAKFYSSIGRNLLAIKSYTKAIDGYVMMDNKSAADSLMSICVPLVQKTPEGESYLFSAVAAYTIEFCTPTEVEAFLDHYQDKELTIEGSMDFAQGYSKIGEYDKALGVLSKVNLGGFILDSLKFASIKTSILEKQGKHEEALHCYRNYSTMLERYHNQLLSEGLLFADKRHQLEMDNLKEIQKRDGIIWGAVCGVFALLLFAGWLHYHVRLNRSKRIMAEKENENLKLEKDNLEKDKKRLEAEQCRHELETANLKLEIAQLEGERDNLRELQKEQSELAKPVLNVIKNRLDMLNGLLAKEITNNDSYAKPYNKWVEAVHNDKKKFMDSTRLAFAASHPKFLEYLEQHGLSTDEINYLCLYAIGLRGKEVGEYTQMKRHYIISHEIRKKLGIDEHETNIGLYIRKLMKDFDK